MGVAVGDHVTRDQIVAHVQTDKAEVELPVPRRARSCASAPRSATCVPVGATLLELIPDEGTALGGTPVRGTHQPASSASVTTATVTPGAPDVGRRRRVQAAPPVRKLARGAGRRPRRRSRAAGPAGGSPPPTCAPRRGEPPHAQPAPETAPGERRVPLRGIRRAMARNMADAWRTVPHISLFDEIDARPLLDAHAAVRASSGRRRSRSPRSSCARVGRRARPRHPILNASASTKRRRDRLPRRDATWASRWRATTGSSCRSCTTRSAAAFAELGDEIARLTAAGRAGHLPPERSAARPSPSPTSAPKAGASPRRSSARRRSRSSGAARSARSPSSTATRWSPRRRCRSRCRPTTAWSTATTPPRSSTRWRRSCANRAQLLDD